MGDSGRTRFWMALEDAFILASVLALWPFILGWQGWVWETARYVAAAGLVWIFVRRLRRYRRRETGQSGRDGDLRPPAT